MEKKERKKERKICVRKKYIYMKKKKEKDEVAIKI
jgi:hypothetical protein